MSENKIPGLVQKLIDDVTNAGGVATEGTPTYWTFSVPCKVVGGGSAQFGIGRVSWYRDEAGKAHIDGVSRAREFAARRGVKL